MKRLLPLLLIGCMVCSSVTAASVSVVNLRVENLTEPLGIDTSEPRFLWMITSEQNDVVQTGYQLVVAGDEGEVWNTGRVASDEQLWIPYRGKRLRSGQHLTWKVKVFTNKGETAWSAEQRFSIGLLTEGQWGGRWIGLESVQTGEKAGQVHSRLAARYLRQLFVLQGKPIRRATAYVSGLGFYRFFVGGQEVGADDMLKPAPSDYRKTIYYNTYDVTAQMADSLVVGIILGNGKYFAPRQDKPYKNTTFGLPKCRVNIIVEYTDGTTQRLVTDEKWRVTASGPIRANNEYDGEEYDARMELSGWLSPGYDASAWLPAERTALPTATLRGQMMAGMNPMGPISPTAAGSQGTIYDFGQNMAGWVSFRPKGKAGDTIRVRYAERLNDDGSLYVANLRNASSTDVYVCNGHETTAWHPSFVYHGFRYVEVTGPAEQVQAWTVGDKMELTGTFECSDTILNKVMEAARWGIASNYKGMPVDCPQRNERQPWLGDRTVGALGESFLYGNERLYAKWMRDICESQRSDGVIPDVAPAFWNYYSDDVTWPAALPFICQMLYEQFGNPQPIRDSYPAMKQWALHMMDEGMRDGLVTKDKYGDWCMPPEKLELIHSQDPARQTDGSLIATAYMIRCLQLLQQFAQMQQLSDDAYYWQKRCEIMATDFNRRFLHVNKGSSPRPGHPLFPDSTYYDNNTATANLLPLAFGIVPEEHRQEVMKNVVTSILEQGNGHVSSGVIGISWLLRTLADNGYQDVAYLIATQKTYPSWGYMVENGATTIWELWNGDKADPAMNSGNHVMLLGDLITWVYQYLGGIRQQPRGDDGATAYKTIQLKPSFHLQDCEWANTTFQSLYGPIVSNWKKTLQHVDWHVEVPCNTSAQLCLPDGSTKLLSSGKYDLSLDIPTADAAIVADEFLYDHTYFPQAHASTIVELKNGDLVASYFGGTKERDPDVCIWVSIKKKGAKQWSAPILAADGVLSLDDPRAPLAGLSGLDGETTPAVNGPIRSLSYKAVAKSGLPDEQNYDYGTKTTRLSGIPESLKRKACWNPVLFQMPGGELWLFFKIGSTVGDWAGWLTKSKDGGRTWSDKEPLPEGFLGPIKNKPLLLASDKDKKGGRLICGSSTESKGWRFHVEIYDLLTRQWQYVGPVESTLAPPTEKPDTLQPIDCIQPSLLQLKDGRLQVLMRTRNGKVATSYSADQGLTWTPVELTTLPNNQSGTDAVTMSDGRHVIIYNDFETLPGTKKGPRTPLSLAVSDDGVTWQHVLTLEDSPVSQYSYPAIIEGRDGTLLMVYTWRRQRVAYKKVNLNLLNR